MATIKSYTSLEQSKKLAEILPLESADMFYSDIFIDEKHKYNFHYLETYGFKTFEDTKQKESKHLSFLPCWSLAALEYLIWNTSVDAVSCPHIYKDRIANGYYVLYGNYETNTCPSIVDACYEMILKLHELNLL